MGSIRADNSSVNERSSGRSQGGGKYEVFIYQTSSRLVLASRGLSRTNIEKRDKRQICKTLAAGDIWCVLVRIQIV
ncbi:hypothetical protein BDZ89DRAFT_364085 [Hymenopellis radicata]|nr:hypothetical protein BDZ89DRAFT_364085 [Hymenopellis radicata]